MINNISKISLILSVVLLTACVSVPTIKERRQNADNIANPLGWRGTTLPTTPYPLLAFMPEQIREANTLTIYIEGDGLAWRSRRRISNNPTPVKPVALQLALKDPQAAAYLARPCQYLDVQSGCNPSLWTSARFSADTITATNQAADLLKQKFSAKHLRLIGYSGGGGIAALVAARRNDVSQLITIAGNLDHVVWTRHHKVSPLSHSLNPADEWRALQDIPQVHFIGEHDDIIGAFVAQSYASRFPQEHRPQIKTVKDTDHYCCWPEQWTKLLKSIKPAD